MWCEYAIPRISLWRAWREYEKSGRWPEVMGERYGPAVAPWIGTREGWAQIE
jgi:hypothetical protein